MVAKWLMPISCENENSYFDILKNFDNQPVLVPMTLTVWTKNPETFPKISTFDLYILVSRCGLGPSFNVNLWDFLPVLSSVPLSTRHTI